MILHRFSADHTEPDHSRVQSWTMYFEASYTTSDNLLLVARPILTTGLQKCLDVNFAVSLSQPSIVKKLRNGSKSGQGT